MRWLPAAAVFAALSVQPAAAQDDDWLRLAPATPWNLDYAEDSCALRRVFGEEGQQVFLELRQYQPGEVMQLIVTSDDIRRRDSAFDFRSARGVTANFIPDNEPYNHGRPMGVDNDNWGKGFISRIGILTGAERDLDTQLTLRQGVDLAITDERREERENEITGLAVGNAFREDFVLETGAMRAPMEAMRACLDELLTHWGIDAEAQKNLLRPVRPLGIERWARELQERYPMEMLRRGQQAIVNVRLTVGEDGRATGCAVQNSLNEATFDELACELLLEHSRFEPALDGNGDPITSYWVTRVIYSIG
ncbi:energy transducer TonB [Aurantiacibacter sp. MUD11]|uniref:energy transducer TonB n=1 Tax=Aurantiacibacter sp. MUD11 TaxID=3003265 RepID=UPI0022AA37E5|nr:energy transducer TonB [Aurantiacibacter sp. MUD11]WAT18669.1 energy transducer TonB [Aurantiacibacter sp. MUD11]